MAPRPKAATAVARAAESHPVVRACQLPPAAVGLARSRPVRSRPVRSRPVRSRPVRSRPVRSRPVRSRPRASPWALGPASGLSGISAWPSGRSCGRLAPTLTLALIPNSSPKP
eukprot:scaffold21348_cov35-Phaeocystis_antarctica.AAC.2